MKFPALPPPTLRRFISYNLGDYEVSPTSFETQNSDATFERFDAVPQSPELLAHLKAIAEQAAGSDEPPMIRAGFEMLGATAIGGEVERGDVRNIQHGSYDFSKTPEGQIKLAAIISRAITELRQGAQV